LVIIGIFLFIWNYLAGTSMFSEESNYFSNRYMHMMTSDYTESNARLTATSLAQYVGAPLYLSLGLFLPAPLLANLVHADSINYTAFSLLENITLYPFMLVGFFIILKNFKQKDYFIPVLIAFIFIMFKIGQANSLQTILSARQSLATITMMYFFIPLCPLNYNKKKTKRWILIIALTISIVYTLVRLYSHGQL
jgi:membrane protein